MTDRPDRGRGTVSFDEMRRGGVGVVVATQIARYVKRSNPLPGWHSPEQAWAMTQGQLAWYREMERSGEMRAIATRAELDAHVATWEAAADPLAARLPIGYVRSLEGADSLVTLDHLERAWRDGLRAIGPAHYGPGTYAQGTDATGGIGEIGRSLLKEMERLGFILDATHLCDDSFWEALDAFGGRVWASHNNCRALVPHNRQFSDDQIRALAARGAVIGVALDAWMIVPGLAARRDDAAGGGRDAADAGRPHRPHLPGRRQRAARRHRQRPRRRLRPRADGRGPARRSPTSPGFPACCARAATRRTTSRPSPAATS